TPLSRTINTAILVALLSALSYALSFAFESGYAGYFGVPAMLVEANPKNLLVCVAAILFGVPVLIQGLDLGLMFWPRSWPVVVRNAVVAVLIMPAFGAVMWFLIGLNPWALTVSLLPFVVLFSVVEFLMPLIVYREHPTYVAKLQAQW